MKDRMILEFICIFTFIASIVCIYLLIQVIHEVNNLETVEPTVIEVEKPIYIEVPVEVKSEELQTEAEVNLVIEDSNYIIDVTDEEIELMTRVVMSESSICDFDVKCAVAATIVNRVLSEDFPSTVTQVVYTNNAYSTQDNGDPDEDCQRAVMYALKYQVFPSNMFYFRTGNYHTFGKPLMKMGTMYFSTK